MSFEAMSYVTQHVRAGGFAQAVLLFLASCHNGETGQCNPSRETIREFFDSEDSPCNIKRIERALARLRELGVIESKVVKSESGVSNWYTFPKMTDTPKTGVTPEMGGTPQNMTTPKTGGSPHFVGGLPPKRGQGVTPKTGAQTGSRNRNEQETVPTAVAEPPSDEKPPEKKPRQKTVPVPEDIPEDWRKEIEEMRPDLDVDLFYRTFKLKNQRVRKALSTWRTTVLNWAGTEWRCTKTQPRQSRSAAFNPTKDYYDEDPF